VTIAFTRTRQQMATLVLGKCGVQDAGTSVASADMEIVYEALDLRLKEIHKLGIVWRKVDEVPLSFSLGAGIATASATVDILFPIKMTVLDGSGDCPVEIIGATEYAEIAEKTRGGVPTQALWKGSAEFVFYPVPVSGTTAKLVYEKIADDTANSTAPDVDVAMMRSLKDIVAYDVGDHFQISEPKMVRWKGEAAQAERDIRKLAVQRKDYAPVAVEDYDVPDRKPSDYGA